MAFFPGELLKYTIIGTSRDEIIDRINNNVEPKKYLWLCFSSVNKPYFGMIYEKGFKIMRYSVIKNGFAPIIIGNIIENNDKNVLEVLMRPHFFTMLFMSITLGIFGIFAPILLFVTSFEIKELFISLLAIIIMLIFLIGSVLIFYSIMVLFFKLESKKSKKFFEKIFEESILEEENDILKIITYIIKGSNVA